MADAGVSGTVGTRRDLQVRLGGTLTPLIVTLGLGSGDPIDDASTTFLAFLYGREADTVPIATPAFDVTKLGPDLGAVRYMIELSKEKVAELVALPPAVGTVTRTGQRTFWWTCFFEDALTARTSVFFGKLTIVLGAANG